MVSWSRSGRALALALAVAVAGCGGAGGDGSGGGGDPDGLAAPPGPAWPGQALAVDAGAYNSCAVAKNGQVYCWGGNASWQLTWPHVPSAFCSTITNDWPCIGRKPVPLTGGTGFKTVSLGPDFPLCGLDASGKAGCWLASPGGASPIEFPAGVTTVNGMAQCGSLPCMIQPLPLRGGRTFASFQFMGTGDFGCGLGTDGKAYCVGSNGQEGSLGSGGALQIYVEPQPVAGNLTFTTLGRSYRAHHVCGLVAGGTAYCWGYDVKYQLGSNTTSASGRLGAGVPYPVQVPGKTFRAIAMGPTHTCAVGTDGVAYCWGYVEYGANGTFPPAYQTWVPTSVAGTSNLVSISTAFAHTCAVDGAGDAWCWGSNGYGQLGSGTGFDGLPVTTPRKVAGGLKWKQVSVGDWHTCGVATDDRVYCWGYATAGRLGAPSRYQGGAFPSDSDRPVEVGK